MSMSYALIRFKTLPEDDRQALKKAGIRNTAKYIEMAKTPADRKALAEKSGLSPEKILRYANMFDMMRLKGVAEENSDLLEAAGVDTIKELRHRKPQNLYDALKELNGDNKRFVKQVPSLNSVARWIEQAKKTEPSLSY